MAAETTVQKRTQRKENVKRKDVKGRRQVHLSCKSIDDMVFMQVSWVRAGVAGCQYAALRVFRKLAYSVHAFNLSLGGTIFQYCPLNAENILFHMVSPDHKGVDAQQHAQ